MKISECLLIGYVVIQDTIQSLIVSKSMIVIL